MTNQDLNTSSLDPSAKLTQNLRENKKTLTWYWLQNLDSSLTTCLLLFLKLHFSKLPVLTHLTLVYTFLPVILLFTIDQRPTLIHLSAFDHNLSTLTDCPWWPDLVHKEKALFWFDLKLGSGLVWTMVGKRKKKNGKWCTVAEHSSIWPLKRSVSLR